jgi:hypothetical protein
MGLLTDPGAGRGKLTQLLVTYHNKLCVLLYIAGVLWFMILAHKHFNAGTYLKATFHVLIKNCNELCLEFNMFFKQVHIFLKMHCFLDL